MNGAYINVYVNVFENLGEYVNNEWKNLNEWMNQYKLNSIYPGSS